MEALLHRIGAERGDDLLAGGLQRALGQVLADQVDRRDERLGLDRQQPRGTREVVRVRLGIDLDRAGLVDLGVEHVRAAAEVHDVEDVDVLAQLGVGDLHRLADLDGVELDPGATGADQDRGERHEAGEALGADRRLAAARGAARRRRLLGRARPRSAATGSAIASVGPRWRS